MRHDTSIVITGASDGIGAEMARQLAARHGAEAGAGARGAQPATSSRPWPRSAAGAGRADAGVSRLDVARRSRSAGRWSTRPCSSFGRIDALVNNAGMSAQALFADVKAEDLHWYEDLMKINLWGSRVVHPRRPAAPEGQPRAASWRCRSLAGLVGVPGRTAYSATKFAMTGFFEALRTELEAAGVSVTTAYPGVVATQIRHRGYNAQRRSRRAPAA